MEAIKAQFEFVEVKAEVVAKLARDVMTELNDLELALVGGGSGDVIF
jgi:hypothetical protein